MTPGAKLSKRKRRKTHSEAHPKRKKVPSSRTSSHPLSARKKIAFAALTTVVFFGLVEGLLSLAGVRAQIAETDPFVGFTSRVPLFVDDSSSGGGKMVTAENKLPWFNRQTFARRKPGNTYRIFCLGGSTTYGRPYDDTTSFCGWLRELLSEAAPSQRFEVINAGGISYASYRVALVVEELADYDPDLIIVYTGHNEFLEDRTYRSIKETSQPIANLTRWLSHTRTYSAAVSVLRPEDDREVPTSADNLLPAEVQTKLDKGVGPDAFTRDDHLEDQILRHFELNLRRIVDLSRAAGADVLLVTPASNLRHCSPFKSETSGQRDATEEQRMFDAMQRGKELLAGGRVEAALEFLDEATAIDDRYAHAHYLRGQCLDRLGRHTEAREAFERARDEDVCPLRALSEVQRIILNVAVEKRTQVVDFHQLVDEHAADGIPGEDLFLDHVHPTVEGHRLLALRILDELFTQSVIPTPSAWGPSVIEQVRSRIDAGVDSRAQGNALRNLAKVLNWAGKRDEANRLALKAAELLDGDANVAYLAANALIEQGDFEQAIEKLRRVIASDPNHAAAHTSLGAAYHQKGLGTKAEVEYLRALEIDPDHTPALNNLATFYLRSGQLEEAAPLLHRAVRLRPRYAKGYHNLGTLYVKQKKWDDAIASFTQAVAIDHEFAQAHADLGSVYESRRNESQAVLHYRQALRIDDHLLMTANSLAALLATSSNAEIRNGEEALRWALLAARGTAFKNPGVFNTLAAAYAAVGDFDEAVSWQRKALQAAPPALQPMCRERIKLYESGRAVHAAEGAG